MGRAVKPTVPPASAPGSFNPLLERGTAPLFPGNRSRSLDERAALRREMDLEAALRLAPQPPKNAAERIRAATRLSKTAAALRGAGQMVQSIHPLRQAVTMNPDDANLHFDLGLTLLRCMRYSEAALPLKRATELKADFTKAYYALAEVCEALGRNADAIAALRRTIECSPNFAKAHQMLGVLLHRTERLQEARASFHRAATAGRNTTLGRICESHVLSEDGRFTEAAEVLRRALVLDPKSHMACTTLGHVLANMGDIDGAIANFYRALTLPGDPVGGWAGLAQFKKFTEADRPIVAEIKTYVEREAVAPREQMTLHFTLGKAYDDLRDYERAMHHFDNANRIRHQLHPVSRDRLRHDVDATIARYTKGFFSERRGDGLRDETPLLVFGMPRSGTTLVEQILSSHDHIVGAGELIFWRDHWLELLKTASKVADAPLARHLGREYLNLLRNSSKTAERIIDKALFSFRWLGLIWQALPQARFVHCRRHPIDTCLSMYFTNFETITEFVADRDDLVFYYQQYLRLMEHWRSVIPSERFIEVDYEDLIAESEKTTRRLVEFCGVVWNPACLRPEENKKAVRTASIWQVRQPIYRTSLERWRNYKPWLGSLCELMPH